jgi:lysosomal Pro-X carboxypeptidase
LTSQLVGDFQAWLVDTWFNLGMVDYPYPADFLAPLPAWPINRTCGFLSTRITDDHQLLVALAQSLGVYYNSSGSAICLNMSDDATSSLGARGWDFQACTEMVMPMCSTPSSINMFPAMAWNMTAYSEGCHTEYGVTPQPFWVETEYGGKDISAYSNIVFSNGHLDPWSGGGVLRSVSPSLVAVVIHDGAHHLDLRAATATDPHDVIVARALERQFISQWIKGHRNTSC